MLPPFTCRILDHFFIIIINEVFLSRTSFLKLKYQHDSVFHPKGIYVLCMAFCSFYTVDDLLSYLSWHFPIPRNLIPSHSDLQVNKVQPTLKMKLKTKNIFIKIHHRRKMESFQSLCMMIEYHNLGERSKLCLNSSFYSGNIRDELFKGTADSLSLTFMCSFACLFVC